MRAESWYGWFGGVVMYREVVETRIGIYPVNPTLLATVYCPAWRDRGVREAVDCLFGRW